jgi:chaperonin GroES
MYDVGFGVLLGPLNETTNTMINQIADAGTMSLTAGGFLARGAKIRGGNYTFAPFQWNRVDSSGEDLSKSMVPLPVREPSAVLFQLLQLLISYVERIAGTTDTQVGENPGQNTPAETMRTMVQEGQRVYTAVYKRIWRSMKEEFKKLYVLNALFLPRRLNYGPNGVVLREDFLGNPDDVVPAADPNVTSEAMQMSQAVMLKQAAGSTPGYNIEEVEKRFLKALKIDGIEQIYPGIAATGQPKDVKVQIAEMKNQTEMLWLQQEQQNFYIEMQEQVRMNDATIAKMQAEIALMSEDIQGDAEDRKIAMMNGMLSLMKDRNAETLSRMDLVKKGLEIKRAIIDASADRGNAKRLEGTSSNRGAA